MMKRVLVIDLDTEREETIRIGPMGSFENEKPDPIGDMSVICEALVTMIRLCHNEGIKDESESIRDCIKHLKMGFVDETYKTELRSK